MTDKPDSESTEGNRVRETPRSRALWERARSTLAGGGQRNAAFSQVYWDRADGADVYDADGNRYLDLAAGQGVLILGNNVPEVREALRDRLDKSYFVQNPCSEVVELSERLCQRFPAVEQLRFMESATKATNGAVRLGRAFTGRDKFAKFVGGYHGTWDGAMVAIPTAYTSSVDVLAPLPGVPRRAHDDVVLLPFNEPDACRRTIERHAGELGTLIMEPLMGDGYVLPLPGFLQMIRDLCDEHGIVLVFDEALTQNLAVGGAQDYFGVVPDLMVIAKSVIGAGLPIAAVGGRADIMTLLVEAPQVYTGATFASHPLSVVAGLAQLPLLTPAVYERVEMLGSRLRDGISRVAHRQGREELTVSGAVGLTFLHWNAKTPTTYAEHLECDAKVLSRLSAEILAAGYIHAGPGRLHVTAAVSEDDIDGFLDAFEGIVERADIPHPSPTHAAVFE